MVVLPAGIVHKYDYPCGMWMGCVPYAYILYLLSLL